MKTPAELKSAYPDDWDAILKMSVDAKEAVKSSFEGIVSELKQSAADADTASNATISRLTGERDDITAKLQALQAKIDAGVQAIGAIIADPETDTEKGITAYLAEATKDERTKEADALDAQISELQAKRAKLKA